MVRELFINLILCIILKSDVSVQVSKKAEENQFKLLINKQELYVQFNNKLLLSMTNSSVLMIFAFI